MKYVTRFVEKICYFPPHKLQVQSMTSGNSNMCGPWSILVFTSRFHKCRQHFIISSLIFVLKAKSQGLARRRNSLRRRIISAGKILTSEDFASSPICFICVHIQTWGACRSMYIYSIIVVVTFAAARCDIWFTSVSLFSTTTPKFSFRP